MPWYHHPESDCHFWADRHPADEPHASYECSLCEEVDETAVPPHIRSQHMAVAAPRPAAAAKDEKESRTVITPIGRASFVHVFEPFAFKAAAGDKQKDPQYSIILVLDDAELKADPKQAKAWLDLRRGVTEAAVAKFGKAGVEELKRRGKLGLPWRNGVEYEEYGEPFGEGTTFISLKSKNPPGIVDPYSRPIMNQDAFYPGCYARASCLPWAYDTNGNKGVTLLLNNCQKARDGDRLAGGRANAEDEFEPLAEGGAGAGDDDGGDLL